MPSHHVDHQHGSAGPTASIIGARGDRTENLGDSVQDIELAVLAVVGGVPLATAASRIGATAADLADAVALYQAAGHAALEVQVISDGWYQVQVEFANWDTAENSMADQLWPRLKAAEADGTLTSWWYIRKSPCWRLRFEAGAAGPTVVKRFVAGALDDVTRRGAAIRWWPSIYEPETSAFGGQLGIAAAHRLFHADSNNILEFLSQARQDPTANPVVGRRELSILLCSTLLRAANQDWHEQGDVWHRVAQMRPLPPDTPLDRLHTLISQIRQLVSLDTSPPSSPAENERPLAFAHDWFAAFTSSGRTLGRTAHQGTLQRGLRDVLAHHVIFHWNRLGLPARTQSVLAYAAVTAILNPAHWQPETGTDVAAA